MARMKKLAEYLKGVCPLFEDLDWKGRKEYETELNKEGVSLYTEFVDHEVREDCVIWRFRCNACAAEEVIHERRHDIEKDFLYIGSCPSDEDPFRQYTTRQTCHAFRIQLRNTFGAEPEGARLYAKYEHGADGYEVCCEWDSRFPLSYAYAHMIEGNVPSKWSPAALQELKRIIE